MTNSFGEDWIVCDILDAGVSATTNNNEAGEKAKNACNRTFDWAQDTGRDLGDYVYDNYLSGDNSNGNTNNNE
jgi:hypothetical protein